MSESKDKTLFSVFRKVVKGTLHEESVYSDGLPIRADSSSDIQVELTTAWIVSVYESDTKEWKDITYKVPVDYGTLVDIHEGVYENATESDKVLRDIKEDFPPDEYENFDW